MKRIIWVFMLAFLLITPNSFAGDEEKAVIKTIKNELNAFLEKDFDAWASCWIHEPYVSNSFFQSYNMNHTKSWDSLSANIKKIMEGDDMKINIEHENYDVHIIDDIAKVFVKSKQNVTYLGEVFDFNNTGVYTLKKIKGEWKLLTLFNLNNTSWEGSGFNTEWNINVAGYYFLRAGKIEEAIKVLTLNTELFPEAFNTWDSLAEAYMKKGDTEKAIKYYKKSHELNSKNIHAKKMIEKMESGEIEK